MKQIFINEKEAEIVRSSLNEVKDTNFEDQSSEFENLLLKINKFLKQDK